MNKKRFLICSIYVRGGVTDLSGTLHINMLRKLYNYLYHDINHNSEKQWIRIKNQYSGSENR